MPSAKATLNRKRSSWRRARRTLPATSSASTSGAIQSNDSASRILIVVEDVEGQRLAEREVFVGNASTNASMSSTTSSSSSSGSNTTSSSSTNTPDPAPSQTIVQNFVIDVKGKDNVAVLTQALQGSTDIQVAAQEVSMDVPTDGNATHPP